MGKVKIKKSDTWIDMTPMSDVMTLLLTFFMLTSTFVKNEPVKVNTPGSIVEKDIPEKGTLTILVSPEKDAKGVATGDGQVFMSMDNAEQLGQVLDQMADANGVSINPAQRQTFTIESTFGVPIRKLPSYLQEIDPTKRQKLLRNYGIPLDSIDGGKSEFQQWVDVARGVNQDIKIVLKADAATPYKTVKKVMNELQDMDESHYYLVTTLKKQEE